MSRRGMVVVGRVAGMYTIKDIKVTVPYKVAVTITPEQMTQSKDLWRSLNQNLVFKLDSPKPPKPPKTSWERILDDEFDPDVQEQAT